MAKTQKMPSKSSRKVGVPHPDRSENPSWLTADPIEDVAAPVTTRKDLLPLLDLRWENFERLCYRLAKSQGHITKAWSYGTSGYGQLGIDILVRRKDGSFEAWQSKRHKTFGVAAVREAITVFENADWANHAKRFVLAVACGVKDPKVVDELEKARTRLLDRGIEFEPLFASELTERLVEQPEIIDDFFGRSWVQVMCAPEALASLADRFSARDMVELRSRLRAFYTAWIATVDPGLPLVGQATGDIPAPTLAQRYVLPDVLVEPSRAEHEVGSAAHKETEARQDSDDSSELIDDLYGPRPTVSHPRTRRLPIGRFLADADRALIVAEAGTGKTTLLRYLALEILADEPGIEIFRTRFAHHVPIWVPFALWARLSEGKERPPSLEDVVREFLEALNASDLAETMRRVLRTGRYVLLVDGLDETSDQSIADALIVSLSSFAERTGAAVYATSRPHGLRALAGVGGAWSRASLAPLTKEQGAHLALLWYRILEAHELGAVASKRTVEQQAGLRARSFTGALTASPGISKLAQTPLFFLSLLKLYRLGRDLPRNRFDASKEIVQQLVDHQPKRRAKDAMRLGPQQRMRQRDRVLEDFAYGLHCGDLRGSVADGALEANAVARAASIITQRTGVDVLEVAEDEARAILSFSEESAGLLVRKTPNDVGFLHRSLQEYHVGAYVVQLPLAQRLAFIGTNAGKATWKEPILYLLYLTANEHEVGQLIQAIAEAGTPDVAEDANRKALLTEAVFADFSHDIPRVRALAEALFAEAELYAPDARQRAIATATVNGLFSQSLAEMCEAKMLEWLPDFHGWRRKSAISAMRNWTGPLREESVPFLFRLLTGDQEYLQEETTSTLAEFTAGDTRIKDKLLHMMRHPRSVASLRAAVSALGLGWTNDDDVKKIAERMRHCPDISIKLDALRLRCLQEVADLTDLKIWLQVAFSEHAFRMEGLPAPEVAEYFARHHHNDLVEALEKEFLSRGYAGRPIPLLHGLLIAEPEHPFVEKCLRDELSQKYGINHIFDHSSLPLERVIWTPELLEIVTTYVQSSDNVSEHEWYRIARVLKLPSLKRRMLTSLKQGGYFTFWSSHALRQFYSEDPEVRAAFTELVDAPPEDFSVVAEDVAYLVDDYDAVRGAVLRSLRAKPRETRYLMAAIRRIGVPQDDEIGRAHV